MSPRTIPTDPKLQRPQRIAVLPGDGIGVDVTAGGGQGPRGGRASAGPCRSSWSTCPYGADHYLETGETLPPGQMEEFRDRFDAILIGAFGDPRVPDMTHAADILLGIRFGLDLYVNFRPVQLLDARLCPLAAARRADVDFVVFRENTEGAYVGDGRQLQEGDARRGRDPGGRSTPARASSGSSARRSSTRGRHGRRKVLMSDKSNVMRYGHDLWQRVFWEVATEYPERRGVAHVRRRALHADGQGRPSSSR